MVSAIIVAGGKGKRMGLGFNKVFARLGGKEIIARTISVFNKCSLIDEIIVVTGAEDIEKMRKVCRRHRFTKVSTITAGGALRQDSVYNGLQKALGDIVLIHDGARCLVTEDIIISVVRDVKTYGASATGVKVTDTLKTVDSDKNIISTVDRSQTVQIQTPQGFKREEILDLHKRIREDKVEVTDDCAVFEYYGKPMHYTEGNYDNIKITTPGDLAIGAVLLKRRLIK